MPYPLRGLRVIITVLWLVAIDSVIMVALNLKASELVMLVAFWRRHVPLDILWPVPSVCAERAVADVPTGGEDSLGSNGPPMSRRGTTITFLRRTRSTMVRVAPVWTLAAVVGGDSAAVRAGPCFSLSATRRS